MLESMLCKIGDVFKIKELGLCCNSSYKIDPSLIPLTVEKLEIDDCSFNEEEDS